MREIKFRGYRNFEGNGLYPPDKRWIYGYYYLQEGKHWIKDAEDWKMSYCVEEGSMGQYTGLKDKNGLTNIYECDIIGVDGIVRGNKYENSNLLQDTTNLVIEGLGTKAWRATEEEAMARGCKYAE